MRISFSGFETPVEVQRGLVTVFEIESRPLFSRVCHSLFSTDGESAVEPYTIWDGAGNEVRPKEALLGVLSPFNLPWDTRDFVAGLYDRMEKSLFENDKTRRNVENLERELSSSLAAFGLQMESDYTFGVEWDIRRYLKAFGFGVDLNDAHSLLDNTMKFLSLAFDVANKKTIMFINLKTFFSKTELEMLYKHAFFLKTSLLLLENAKDSSYYSYERKVCIDQHFLECVIEPV